MPGDTSDDVLRRARKTLERMRDDALQRYTRNPSDWRASERFDAYQDALDALGER